MTLREYYKAHVFEYAYNDGYDDCKAGTPNPMRYQEDIYWQDEMDYYICADYYGSYVGGYEDWTQEDKEFLTALGFEPSDFIDTE